jgi:F-type H+-transporting ATPase subunit epsilon
MADTFELLLATPDRQVLRETVSEAQIPSAKGYIGVLPDHAALIGEMGTGTLSYVEGGQHGSIAVSGGWLEIRDNHVTVLAGAAEKASEIDVGRAELSLKRAQERSADPPPGTDIVRCLRAMARAQARIETARHHE